METKNRPPLTDEEGEVREITAEDMHLFKPAAEVAPKLVAMAKKRGAPKKAVTKKQVCLRLDRDIIQSYESSGSGWNGRLNKDLRKARGLD